MYQVVLMRHGESQWNLENRFTGWKDVDLTEKGRQQALEAGQLLKEKGYHFDMAFTSVLKRAIRTLWIVLDEMDIMYTPYTPDWRLNERHYGALQGLNKAETAQKYGDDQVLIWRRAFAVAPNAMDLDDERHPRFDSRYQDIPAELLPSAECLKDTIERVVPFWKESIVPQIKEGKKILITAHGNSLRALIKHLDDISEEDIVNLNIPTGQPLVLELNEQFKVTDRYFIGDAKAIAAAQVAVANQGKAE